MFRIRRAYVKHQIAFRLYHAALSDHGKPIDTDELAASCFSIAEDDEAGQDWCEENGYAGYTSYASLDDLPYRFPIFKDLVAVLDKHVAAFAKDLDFDLGERKLVLDSLWLNILPEGGIHTSHIHPHSVIPGTTYVTMPEGASAIRFDAYGLPQQAELPLAAPLPNTAWQMERRTRADRGHASVIKTWEDSPFYARSTLGARIYGEQVVAVQESLNLKRFASPVVQFMLPYRMPRVGA